LAANPRDLFGHLQGMGNKFVEIVFGDYLKQQMHKLVVFVVVFSFVAARFDSVSLHYFFFGLQKAFFLDTDKFHNNVRACAMETRTTETFMASGD
jgi:hypothetical protein